MKYLIATIAVEREGDDYVSQCLELGMASCGATEQEAFDNALDATLLYLNTLEDLGECSQVLREKGLAMHEGPAVGPSLRCPPGSSVRPIVLPIPHTQMHEPQTTLHQ